MRTKPVPRTVRRSVALPRPLLEQVTALAPPELPGNLNRLVRVALQEFAATRKARAFQHAMARMAADPEVRKECASIARDFESPRGASVHACEPAVLPASVPLAFCPATSRLENRPTKPRRRPAACPPGPG